MALTTALLHELSTNTLERNLDLVRLTLKSSAYIPRKREIIILWLYKNLRQHKESDTHDVLTLWKLLHEVIQDVVAEEVTVLMQKGFLELVTQGIQTQLHPDSSQEGYVLKVAKSLLEKTPTGILRLQQIDLESMLLTVLKCCCDFMSEGKNDTELISVLSLLLINITSAWQKHLHSVKTAILHLKPLLGFMTMILKLTENSTLPQLAPIPSQIKKCISAALFNKSNFTDWVEYLNAILEAEEKPLAPNNPKKDEKGPAENAKEETNTEEATPAPSNATPALAESDSTSEVLKKTLGVESQMEKSLGQIRTLADEAFESMSSRGYPAVDYIPLILPVILEEFMSCNRSGNMQCDVALLAYLVTLIGIKSNVPFEVRKFKVLKLDKQQKLSCLHSLLQVYQRNEGFHTMLMQPQKKNGAFKPKTWLREVGTCIASLNHKCPSWFACVNTAMHISPSLVEGIMVNVLQKCWATSSLKNSEIVDPRNMLLENVVTTYEKLFRLPKLLRNIFSSLSPLETKGTHHPCIPSSVLKKFASCCISMSSGQLTECWSLFLNQLDHWSEMKEGHEIVKITVTVDLFCTFLYHIQAAAPTMPAVHVAMISKLMDDTSSLASQMLKCGIRIRGMKRARCALCILHAWGEVHIILQSYRRSYGEAVTRPTLETPLEGKDLSYLHPTLTRDNVAALLEASNTTRDVLYALLVLQIQKIRALLLRDEAANDTVAGSILAAATFIFSNANVMSSCKPWDQRVYELSGEKFATAALQLLLSYIPLMADCLTAKNLLQLCEWLLHVLQEPDDAPLSDDFIYPKRIVVKYLSSASFRENRPMQTAYVTALFRNLSERIKLKKRSHDSEDAASPFKRLFEILSSSPPTWKKYAETTPQVDYTSKKLVGPDDLDKMWNIIYKASQLAMEVMGSEECCEYVDKDGITFILQAMEFLPLEDLLPGNQTRSLIGLLGVLFLLRDALKDATEGSEKTALIKTTCYLLITLLDGTRRPWLLDFLDGGFLFHKIATLFSKDFSQDLEDTALFSIYEDLLNRIVQDAFRKKNTIRTFTPLVKEFKDQIFTAAALKSKPFSAAAIILFKQFVTVVSKKFLHEDTKHYIQKSAFTLSQAFDLWLTHFLEDTAWHVEGRKQAFQISTLQLKYRVAASRLQEGDEEPSTEVLSAVLSMACTHVMQFKDISSIHEDALSFLSVAIKQRGDSLASPDVFSIPATWMGAVFIFTAAAEQSAGTAHVGLENCLSEEQVSFLHGTLKCCTPLEINDIFEKLLTAMLSDEVQSPAAMVHLRTFQVLCSILPKESGSSKDIANVLQKYVEHFSVTLAFLNMKQDSVLISGILRILSTLLRLKKPSITHQSTFVILQVLCTLDLTAAIHDVESFCNCYQTVCGMLCVFLHHRVYLIDGCASIFHTCIAMLMRSLVKASGIEEIGRHSHTLVSKLQLCASSLESVATLLLEHKREFGKIAPFLIAEYVASSADLTLCTPVKNTLTFVIYKLFEISNLPSSEMLLLTLPKEHVEVYKSLYSGAQKMHFKGEI